MVTEEEPSDMELASEMIPVPQVSEQEEIHHDDEPNQLDDLPQAKKSRTRKKKLHAAIRKQMEFYFSDANLSKDRFLANLIKENPCVNLEVFLQFNKIRALTLDSGRIAKALQESDMLEVSEDGTKVKRITPIGVKENSDECTIYVQRLPQDADHDLLSSIFSQYGSIAYISIPKYKQSHNIKGFAFIEFDTTESAEKCLKAFRAKGYELPSETSPNHVLSITTYNENKNKDDTNPAEKNPTEETSLNKSIEIIECENNENNVDTINTKKSRKRTAQQSLNSSTEDVIHISKSKKKKDNTVDQIASEQVLDITEDQIIEHEFDSSKKCKRKRKLTEELEDSSLKKTSAKKKSEENAELNPVDITESYKKSKNKKKIHDSSANVEEQDLEFVNEQLDNKSGEANSENQDECNILTKEKKKKNRNRSYKKSEKIDATDMGLQVMAKKDWKKLRNKYLDLQKSKMHQLKQHLFKTRRNQRNNPDRMRAEKDEVEEIKINPKQDKIRNFPFTPGMIVKIEMDQPCMDSQSFKKEFKCNTSVKYVDLCDGSLTAYIRFDTVDAANEMAQKSSNERKMTVIKDDEEKMYWGKMMADRAEKLSKKIKINQRGRNKLLKKAEKELGKHIKFEEV